MDGLTVLWTATAKQQRDYIFDYWNNRNNNTKYSKKLNSAIRVRTQMLKSYPEAGKAAEFKETRAVIMGHYSILYKFLRPKIIITGFWDNRRDPEKLLKFLKDA